MMNNDEQHITKAYQALQQEEPITSPPELDAAILAESRRAVSSAPQSINADKPKRSAILRWSAPFATAALVVLSVSIYTIQPRIEQVTDLSSYTEDYAQASPITAEPIAKMAKETSDVKGSGFAGHAETGSKIVVEKPPELGVKLKPVSQAQAKRVYSAKRTTPRPVIEQNADKPEVLIGASKVELAAEMTVQPQSSIARSSAPVSREIVKRERIAENAIVLQAERQIASAPAAIAYADSTEVWHASELEESSSDKPIISAEQWVKQIEALIDNDKLQAASQQFEAFKETYPNHAFVKRYHGLLEDQETEDE